MKIIPLAISQQFYLPEGAFSCVGAFENALNLISAQGDLITLHRYGKGLSPFGCLLRRVDFDALSAAITPKTPLFATQHGLFVGQYQITLASRRINCQLPRSAPVTCRVFEQAILQLPVMTGLWGNLAEIIRTFPKGTELEQLQDYFIAALTGTAVNWRPIIGKGMGLTPSNDDTLVGMLYARFLQGIPHHFFSDEIYQSLDQLTTYVSVAYLRAATQGLFSTPLIHLCHALAAKRDLQASLVGVNALGHSSGADTLLGIWLGLKALESIKYK